MKKLLDILSYRRKAGSKSEAAFIKKYILPLKPFIFEAPDGEILAYGVEVGSGSKTLFSAHTDTVSRTDGKQIVTYDEGTAMIYKDGKDQECLGADDGAGIWLMLEMIKAKVPGYYVWHTQEECGGIGSSGMAKHHKDFLATFNRAVAFDRGGTQDVITHQGWSRCCSDEFAEALSEALNAGGTLKMRPDDGGVFTDTANYTGIVAECSNCAIGYQNQHTPNETLDVEYLLKLRDAVIGVDWEALPTVRDPSKVEQKNWYSGYKFHDEYVCGYEPAENVDDMLGWPYTKILKWVEGNRFDPDAIAEAMYEMLDRVAYSEQVMADAELGATNDAMFNR